MFFSLKSFNLFIKRYSSGSSNLFESVGFVKVLFYYFFELDYLGYIDFFLDELDLTEGLYSVFFEFDLRLYEDSISLSKLSFLY